jgi:hypothetical protein
MGNQWFVQLPHPPPQLLLTTARGLSFGRVRNDRDVFGALLESFVFAEILKLMTASDLRSTPYHFRDLQMRE